MLTVSFSDGKSPQPINKYMFLYMLHRLDTSMRLLLLHLCAAKKKGGEIQHVKWRSGIFTKHRGVWHVWSSAHNKTATAPFIISLQMILIAASYLM